MRNTVLNKLFIVLLVLTLVLFTVNYIIDSNEIGVNNYYGLVEINGEIQSFEVFHESPNINYPTKKNTERYDEKLLDYLDHIQESRDNTFMKGKVFLKGK